MSAILDVVLIAEDQSDARRAQLLTDRAIIEGIEWLRDQPGLLASQREWRGLDASMSFLDVHRVHAFADRAQLPRPRGSFDGRPPAAGYRVAVRALWLLTELNRPRAVIWVGDTDGDPQRRQGWRDACKKAGSEFEILIGGFPDECMEAWLLVAWSPDHEGARAVLEGERERLGFWPHEAPERLSHKKHVKRSIKAVCETLDVDDSVLDTAKLDKLLARGEGCGLRDFLEQVGQQLVPAIRAG